MLIQQLVEAGYDSGSSKPKYTNLSAEQVLNMFYDKEVFDEGYDDEHVNWSIKSGLTATFDGSDVGEVSGSQTPDEVYWYSGDRERSGNPSSFEIHQSRLLYRKQ